METDSVPSSPLDIAKDMLGKKIRVRISDGRLIEGIFECLDRELNIVVGHAIEFHGVNGDLDSTEGVSCRHIGMAVVPGMHIMECYVAQ